MELQYRFTFIHIVEESYKELSLPRAWSHPALSKHRADLATDAQARESANAANVAALPQRVELLREEMRSNNKFRPSAGRSDQSRKANGCLGTSSVPGQCALSTSGTGAQAFCSLAIQRDCAAPSSSDLERFPLLSSTDSSSEICLPSMHPQSARIASTTGLKGRRHSKAFDSADVTLSATPTSASLPMPDQFVTFSSLPSWDDIASQRPTLDSLPDLEGNGAFHLTSDSLPELEGTSMFPTSGSLPALGEDAEPMNGVIAHESQGEAAPSPGSFGHPELCRRLCIHFARNQCTNGAQCSFCHLDHSDSVRVHLDKMHRNLLKDLSPSVIVPFVAKHVRERARDRGVLAEVMDVVLILEKWAIAILAAQNYYKVSSQQAEEKDDRVLRRACKRLPISACVSILLRMDLERNASTVNMAGYSDVDFKAELLDAWRRVQPQ